MKIFYKSGLTLLEILVALSIFGIVSIVCLSNYLLCLKNIKIINDKIKILLLTQNKIEEIKIKGNIDETTGFLRHKDDEKFEWKIELSDTIIMDTEENIKFQPYKLTVKCDREEVSIILPFFKIIQ